jgi:hypothetical protein
VHAEVGDLKQRAAGGHSYLTRGSR